MWLTTALNFYKGLHVFCYSHHEHNAASGKPHASLMVVKSNHSHGFFGEYVHKKEGEIIAIYIYMVQRRVGNDYWLSSLIE